MTNRHQLKWQNIFLRAPDQPLSINGASARFFGVGVYAPPGELPRQFRAPLPPSLPPGRHGTYVMSVTELSAWRLHVFSQLGIAATSETSHDARLARRAYPGKLVRRATLRFFQQHGRMWRFLIDLYIAA
jgi:hypothetical protein